MDARPYLLLSVKLVSSGNERYSYDTYDAEGRQDWQAGNCQKAGPVTRSLFKMVMFLLAPPHLTKFPMCMENISERRDTECGANTSLRAEGDMKGPTRELPALRMGFAALLWQTGRDERRDCLKASIINYKDLF